MKAKRVFGPVIKAVAKQKVLKRRAATFIQRQWRTRVANEWFLTWRRKKYQSYLTLQRFARKCLMVARFRQMVRLKRRHVENIEAGKMLYIKTLYCCYMDTVILHYFLHLELVACYLTAVFNSDMGWCKKH
jgi:hypothetical protein